MSRKGECYDNTVVESFSHILRNLKNDQFEDQLYPTREKARRAVIDYIEMFYNYHRLHSSLGYTATNDYEMNLALKKVA